MNILSALSNIFFCAFSSKEVLACQQSIGQKTANIRFLGGDEGVLAGNQSMSVGNLALQSSV